ncbi:MAG: insulinase family protein [Bacteroidia bacterium]|nr:insulinase family protein [Bacteroidia bacterium]MCX7764885.1 insulinase family protein [Bacteroidia bacterium]MDW8057202.1 pitrilysin family protein [Bacteroidia bacterium]
MEQLAPRVWYWQRPHATSIYALLLWNVGSRHDPPQKEGLLHFLEHTLFKGTKRRSAQALSHRIERLGGELNAFTTKDKMGIEVRIAPHFLYTALSTLYELYREATFPEKEVEKEREVILEEEAMYEDIPEESLLDHFEEQIFTEGGLRHPIIGYPESIRAISAEDIRRFYEDYLQKSPFVLMLTGPLSVRETLGILKRTPWTGEYPTVSIPWTLEKVAPPAALHVGRRTQQAHLVIGGLGPSLYDWKESIALQLLLHELGGGMSSRLFRLLREKYGWCYNVYTFFYGYPDRSVWGIYAGLSPEAWTSAREVVLTQLKELMDKRLSEKKLKDLRRGFLGKQALAWESPGFRLSAQGRSILDMGALFDLHGWQEVALSLTSANLQETAQKAFSTLYERAYLPSESLMPTPEPTLP